MTHLKNISFRLFRVWRRDWDVYLTTWFVSCLPPLLEPVLYLLAFGLGLGSMVQDIQYHGHSLKYVTFMAPGVVAIAIMFHSYYECLYGSFVRMYYQKTFDAIISTPLTLEDVVGGEIVWGATKGTIASAIMLLPISLFGLVRPELFILVPMIAFLGGLFFASLGMCFTAICPTIETFNFPVFMFITPMMLFSGTFFPLDVLPPWAQTVAYLLPLTHLVEWLRGIMIRVPVVNLKYHLLMFIGGIAVFFPMALVMMRRRLIR